MNELLALITFAFGIPLLMIGYIMSVIAVKHMKATWKFGMILGYPIVLPFFALIHWQRAIKPFIYSTVGMLLLIYTWLSIPE